MHLVSCIENIYSLNCKENSKRHLPIILIMTFLLSSWITLLMFSYYSKEEIEDKKSLHNKSFLVLFLFIIYKIINQIWDKCLKTQFIERDNK